MSKWKLCWLIGLTGLTIGWGGCGLSDLKLVMFKDLIQDVILNTFIRGSVT